MQQLISRISLSAIRRNAAAVKRFAGLPLIAVLKDDAYGHGAEKTALALHGIADGFAVATAEEGAALALTGAKNVLVLTPPLSGEDALRIVGNGLIGSFSSLPALRLLVWAGEKLGEVPKMHLAVNTGMNRYGVRPERAKSCAREALCAGAELKGVYSHLYLPENREAALGQKALFLAAASGVKEYFPEAVSHLSATGGLAECGGTDAVRVGLALYGYLPAHLKGKLAVSPAMKVYAAVAQSGAFTGGGVGYAAAEREYGALHTLRMGYGDGLFRAGGEGAVGRLCMDACIREGRAPFGKLRRVLADPEGYAAAHGTIVYEVLVRMGKSAVKVYV